MQLDSGVPADRSRCPIHRHPLALASALLLVAVAPARAQSVRVDVGSFTTFVDGRRAGREQFSLQSTTSALGHNFELRMESAEGERRAAVRLETDSAGTPLRYTVEERDGARITRRLGGQRVRGRFATLSRGVRGEAAREYLLSAGAVVLERDGIHQYSMLLRNRTLGEGDSVRVATLAPVENRQGGVTLSLESLSDTVTIAGSRRSARRWRATTDNGEPRLIWADPDGRIMRLRIPSRHFEALRDDVPR